MTCPLRWMVMQETGCSVLQWRNDEGMWQDVPGVDERGPLHGLRHLGPVAFDGDGGGEQGNSDGD